MRSSVGHRLRAARQLASLVRYARRRSLAAAVLLHLAVGALPVAFSVGLGLALRELAAGTGREPWWLAGALAAFVAQQVLAPWQAVVGHVVARQVDAAVSTRLMRFALTGAPLAAVEDPDVARELGEAARGLDGSWLSPGDAVDGALALVARYTQLAGAVAVLAVVVGPGAALLGLVVAVVLRLGQTTALLRFTRLYESLGGPRRRMLHIGELGADPRAAKDVRALGLVGWLEQRYTALADDYAAPHWAGRRRIYGRPFVLYAVLALAGGAGVLVAVAHTAGDVGRFSMALQAALLCVAFGVELFAESDMKIGLGRTAWTALLRAEELTASAAPVGGTDPAPALTRELRFDGVHFAYTPDRPVLAGLDLVLPAGTSTAVVGVNGAGKTTAVKLLTGLYRPTRGAVRCDGVDLADVAAPDWQARVAVVFQDFVRYELDLADNVAMAASAHRGDVAGIREVLTAVGLGGLAPDTPLTRLLPGGRDLSGGQWQRVALARALFAVRHGATLLVLDEPTAQLDARGEAEFYSTFLDLTRGVTSLLISHRFSSVRRADRIVVLEDGRAAEHGTHDELVAAGARYADLFAVQARRFEP